LTSFSSNRHLIYTVITGDYDELTKPLWHPANVDFLAVVDRHYTGKIVAPWSRMVVEPPGDAKQANRNLKMKLLAEGKNYASLTYIDGNIRIIRSMARSIDHVLSRGKALGIFEHSERSTPFEEITECLLQKKLSYAEAEFEQSRLARRGSDSVRFGLFDGGVLILNPRVTTAEQILERWATLFKENPARDQISLSIVQKEFQEEIVVFPHWRTSMFPIIVRCPHSKPSVNEFRLIRLIQNFPRLFSFLQQFRTFLTGRHRQNFRIHLDHVALSKNRTRS